jgi:5-methylcytosine-specific restriction protein A
MKTFLFAWNPDKWQWDSLSGLIDQVTHIGKATERWTISAHRQVQVGDRAFLMKLGRQQPKGIMASGFVASAPFKSEHWAAPGKMVWRVMIDFEQILNPNSESLLDNNLLKQGKMKEFNWSPFSSGVVVPTRIATELEKQWFTFLNGRAAGIDTLVENESTQESFLDGAANQMLTTRYERNPYARKVCLRKFGHACSVCGFDFEQAYGSIGKGFIHVHHLNQLSQVGKEHILDPMRDLRPVCPNCHAMLHKRKRPYSIEEMKNILQEKQ